MAEFKACDRQYVKTTWEPSAFITALEYMKVTNINALENKLLTGDKYDFKKKEIVRSSPFRKQVLPGILVLSGNTYGRYKNKLYYKCIPNDKSLPVFLVPYQEKNINFNKSKIDKFVLFVFQKWTDKHPFGILQQTLGDVSDMSAFEEHQMNCKDINHSIQKFSKHTFKIIKKKTSEVKDIIDDIVEKYDIIDRTNERVISVDPDGCTDIDDAFSVKFDSDSPWKTTISIYIANVPLWFDYLDLWSHLDRRVSTIYLSNERRAMLPTILSENLCSLKKNTRRFAIAMDLLLLGSKINSVEFNNVVIKVDKNYSYDDKSLIDDNVYHEAEKFARKINDIYKFIDKVNDSHEVVQLFMVMMNNFVGKYLRDEIDGKAIYRSFRMAPISENIRIPDEMKDFARTWKSSGGIYTSNSNSDHDMMNSVIDVYAHSTSPIRRLVDLVNMTLLTHSKGIIRDDGKRFADNWIDKLAYINNQMKSTRKVQNDVKLLNTCLNIENLSDKTFEGYIIEVEQENEERKYTVLLKEINCISIFRSEKQYDLYDKGEYSLHIFNDEYNLKQKIRIFHL